MAARGRECKHIFPYDVTSDYTNDVASMALVRECAAGTYVSIAMRIMNMQPRASIARIVDNVVRGLKFVNGRNSTCFMIASTFSQEPTAGPDGSGHGRKSGLNTNTLGTGMLTCVAIRAQASE